MPVKFYSSVLDLLLFNIFNKFWNSYFANYADNSTPDDTNPSEPKNIYRLISIHYLRFNSYLLGFSRMT